MTSALNDTNDIDSSTPPLNVPSSIQQDVRSCLDNIFLSPAQGIEQAFNIILESLASQKEELDKVKEDNNILEEKLKGLRDSGLLMTEKIEESNRRENHLEKEVQDLKNDIKEMKVMVGGIDELGLKGIVKDFVALKNEVNVMAFNLQLDVGTDETVANEKSVDQGSITLTRHNSREDSGGDGSEEVSDGKSVIEETSTTDPEVDVEQTVESEPSKSVESESSETVETEPFTSNPVDAKPSDPKSSDNVHVSSQPPLGKMNHNRNMPHKRSRRIATRKFEVHETLAARLKRLEVDKEKVKQDISEIRETMKQIGPLDTLAEMRERILMLEMFLDGFGGVQVPLNGEPPHFFGADSILMSDNLINNESIENGADNTVTSYQGGDDRGSSDEGEVIGVDLALDGNDGGNDSNEKDASSCEDSSSSNLAVTRVGGSNINERSQYLSDYECRRPSTTSSIGKRQGLFLHLADQEVRLQDMIADVSSRLLVLEELCNNRVSRKSMETFFAQNCADPRAWSSLEELMHDIEQMRDSIDEKVSKDMLRKELETYLFQNSSPSPSVTDDDKTFRANVQRQLQFLNDDKVGKNTLDTTVSFSEEAISKRFDESLVVYEEKIAASMSALHLSLNECKESIRAMENQSLGAASGVDIDERIKNAANAMQSNLKEIISSRLEGLKQVEDEMEKVTSQLADKPDQDQINKMIQDLESAVVKHDGADNTAKDIIQNMKSGE